MKKIGFVIPWYADAIPGGAEMELREVSSHLHYAGVAVEILTTCVKEFGSDWSVNYYKEGEDSTANGITIRRFKVRKRDNAAFDAVNAKLMAKTPITPEEEETFLREMVNSPDLYAYMSEHVDDYSLFVFIPYMFGTTYYGAQVCPYKSVLIPCFHDEAYAYIGKFKELFPKTVGMVFNARPEAELAERLYGFSQSGTKTIVMGIGMDTDIVPDPAAFREKFKVKEPFILYAGRKDEGKNVHTLVKYYAESDSLTDRINTTLREQQSSCASRQKTKASRSLSWKAGFAADLFSFMQTALLQETLLLNPTEVCISETISSLKAAPITSSNIKTRHG